MPAKKYFVAPGQVFGQLTVVEEITRYRGTHAKRYCACTCACGRATTVALHNLTKVPHPTRSCGCWRRTRAASALRTHGAFGTLTHSSWYAMRMRCLQPTHNAFPAYGARGITIDPAWDLFEQFLSDMGPRPSKAHSLDRIDNSKGYTPSNCRWATREQQAQNRQSVMLTAPLVRDIRARALAGEQAGDIARSLAVPYPVIWAVVAKKTWKNVE